MKQLSELQAFQELEKPGAPKTCHEKEKKETNEEPVLTNGIFLNISNLLCYFYFLIQKNQHV